MSVLAWRDDPQCECFHSGSEHARARGRCQALDSYGIRCDCASLVVMDLEDDEDPPEDHEGMRLHSLPYEESMHALDLADHYGENSAWEQRYRDYGSVA